MRVLMIAYGFPPGSSSSTFRPLYFAKHLYEQGDAITVLTVREQDYLPDHPRDEKLMAELPEDVRVFRSRVFRPREAVLGAWNSLRNTEKDPQKDEQKRSCSVPQRVSSRNRSWFQEFKDIVTDLLSTPDKQIGWLPSAVWQGRKVIQREHIDVIYATGGPWTSLLIGGILKAMTGRPLVIDFRDPWTANPSPSSDSQFIQSFEPLLEKKASFQADHIIANTEELRQDFLSRYPTLSEQAITTIPNGFESYIDGEAPQNSRCTLTHAGLLYFSRNPKYVFQALLELIETSRIPQNEFYCLCLGGIDTSINDPELDALLSHQLLQGVVDVLPRVPYQEAMAYQQRSDILFLLQPDFPLQIPRKLYEYLAFRRPILGVTDRDGATARIIQKHSLGMVVENRTEEIETALLQLYNQWKNGQLPQLSRKSCDTFKNEELTRQLRNILQQCLQQH